MMHRDRLGSAIHTQLVEETSKYFYLSPSTTGTSEQAHLDRFQATDTNNTTSMGATMVSFVGTSSN